MATPEPDWQPPGEPTPARPALAAAGHEAAVGTLRARDAALNAALAGGPPGSALPAWAVNRARLYRARHAPLGGREAWSMLSAVVGHAATADAGASAAGDLGFSRGDGVWATGGDDASLRFASVRFWSREPGGERVLTLDVSVPLPAGT